MKSLPFSGGNEVITPAITSREYCVYERFTARCESDEVIFIWSALYGRMQARRCITSDYVNALGCYSDVTGYMDSVCSGRQNCSVLVATIDSVAQPCAKDFKSYLEAAFDCIKGFHFALSESQELSTVFDRLTLCGHIQFLPIVYIFIWMFFILG